MVNSGRVEFDTYFALVYMTMQGTVSEEVGPV